MLYVGPATSDEHDLTYIVVCVCTLQGELPHARQVIVVVLSPPSNTLRATQRTKLKTRWIKPNHGALAK